MANLIGPSSRAQQRTEPTRAPAVPRPVQIAVLAGLVVAVLLQWHRPAPPVRQPQDVAAWLASPQRIAQWQAELREEGVEALLIEYDPGNVLERVGLDTNSDQRADLVGIYRAGRLVRVARDDNRDNRIDDWVLVKSDADGKNRLESDRNFDGVVDTWTEVRAGLVQTIQSDTDGDGKIDRWEFYTEGKLKEITSDNDGDGRPEQWEHYSSSGELALVEYDLDGDGVTDSSFSPARDG